MIKLEKVNKYFYRYKKNQIHVINDTSVEFGNKGLVALLGPSGCGKTTLLNTIGGLDKVSKGKIFINGKRITKKSSYKIDKIRNLNIGYIFQDYYLVDNLSVFDNVALALKICGIKNKEEIKKRVNYVLEKVGMYRYRNRYANMLSGGERQRVGIARAIVKDPNVIIADEPTGNLDSKNSLMVMNIIKAISKDRLVVLVTHERELAEFYASRIIEIEDGKIVEDRNNSHTNDLDYKIDNKIYLKDFKKQEKIDNKNLNINYYSDEESNVSINVIVQNGNIYIESKDKVEVVDEDSNVEIVNDHYQKISKSIYEEYDFDFKKIINQKYKMKYSSIYNPISLIVNGFKKIRDYKFIKKLLLFGFLASGMFIAYSAFAVSGITHVEDKDYVSKNVNYLDVEMSKISVKDYLEYEKEESINYIIPGNSMLSFTLELNNYYQTAENNISFSASLSSLNMINDSNLIYGRMPENKNEIVIDKRIYDIQEEYGQFTQTGMFKLEHLIDKNIIIDNMDKLTIVGIVDLNSPSLYTYESNFINIIFNSQSNGEDYSYGFGFGTVEYADSKVSTGYNTEILDYKLMKDDVKLKKGRWPRNTYETVINYSLKDSYKIGKKVDIKVNGYKLKVVGYYTSKKDINKYLVTNKTIKYDLIRNSYNMAIYSKDKKVTLDKLKSMKLNITDSYETSKNKYMTERKKSINSCLISSGIILLISLIEIYLMIRASFLSRVKEVGTYRAIGMKKKDIYKIFMGEIIAITSIGSLTGVLLMSYIVSQLTKIDYFTRILKINWLLIGIVIVFIYIFNIIIGLIPVYRTIRKTPAQILSRNDI